MDIMPVCREHALDVANDGILSALFAQECWTDATNFFKGRPVRRFCVSDEHYIPTLLAHLGTLQAVPVEYLAAPLQNLRSITCGEALSEHVMIVMIIMKQEFMQQPSCTRLHRTTQVPLLMCAVFSICRERQ